VKRSENSLVYYVTAHGYGHGSRSCDILQDLQRLRPDIPITIVSELAEKFFFDRLGEGRIRWRPGRFDVGLVQRDSIRADVDATLEPWGKLLAQRSRLVDEEARFLDLTRAALVVADIPALPLEAAAQVGIPSIAIGNFGWDWIYSAYRGRHQDWDSVITSIEDGYRKADLLLRLPFSEPMSIFDRQVCIPLVSEPGRKRRDWIARTSGADPTKTWYLLSFSTLEFDTGAVRKMSEIHDVEFITVLPLSWDAPNFHELDNAQIRFPDIVASCDAVISKPGFGILSECVVNRKPIIYVERTDFLEYDVLEKGIKETLQHVHLPAERLYKGEMRKALDQLLDAPQPRHLLEGGGAAKASRILADYWELGLKLPDRRKVAGWLPPPIGSS